MTDEAAVKAAFEKTRESFGRLDLLFNNAGTFAHGVPLDELKLEDWRRVVDVNLTGPFLCAREAIRIMKAQKPKGGRIINNRWPPQYTSVSFPPKIRITSGADHGDRETATTRPLHI